jgi:hypothetical protein
MVNARISIHHLIVFFIIIGGYEQCHASNMPDLVFSFQLGSPDAEVGSDITVDKQDNFYITGSFEGTIDFDPGPGVNKLTSIYSDGFIAKYNPGGGLIWVRQIVTSGVCFITSIAVDSQGNLYTTGRFDGTCDFDPDPNEQKNFHFLLSKACPKIVILMTIDCLKIK